MEGHAETDDWVTIDQLAQRSGVTVRNIRAYQARGLLPPPQVRSRTGYYGPEHAARLALVQELSSEGVKLDTVKKLLDTTGGSTERVLHFLRTIRQAFAEQERTIASEAELAERFGTTSQATLRRAQKLGLLRRIDEEQYEEVSPRLTRAAQSLVELGIPIEKGLDVAEQLRRHADGIAKTYVQLFLDEVWKPFDDEGRPDDQWERIDVAVRELRRIAGEAMTASLELAVSDRLDVTFGREITRNVRTGRRESPAG